MYIYTRIIDETTTKNSIEASKLQKKDKSTWNVQAHAYNVFFFLVWESNLEKKVKQHTVIWLFYGHNYTQTKKKKVWSA